MIAFTSDQWVIVALIFLLGLLIGAFLTAGGRRKWKARYREESARREALERENRDREAQWASREKELAAHDSARTAAIRENRRDPAARDSDADGVSDAADRRPTDDRRA
jgi:C4-dicarboxylate-specific signal transduction histidine kinase